MLSGAAGAAGLFPESIQRALAINPAAGTTWKDAEHVVILMQENRSFDHSYGSLPGVRGFNDPRAHLLPNKNLVWLQSNNKGETHIPFRHNIRETNITWLGSLPHGWTDQVDARNGGRFDKWLENKRSGNKEYKDVPLTMGFYSREDIPFYYSLADAFTVCDQNFCSSLTGTTPNRLYLWTGKVRNDVNTQPCVRNEEADFETMVNWRTFPELLEQNGISWKIYQNEIYQSVGFDGDENSWLSNFGDNPIEYFEQYKVGFVSSYRKHLPKYIEKLQQELDSSTAKMNGMTPGEEYNRLVGRTTYLKEELAKCRKHAELYTDANYEKLSPLEKSLIEKAFAINDEDPDYRKMEKIAYDDRGTQREMHVPKGDVFYQFRKDVNNNKLPAVSWLVAPENFSDHPSSPWYGSWYLSEAIDILTKNPEVWKKTIFILCYDENDGYFDHVLPFVPPIPGDRSTGFTSKTVDTSMEVLPLEMDLKRAPKNRARGGPIGLGYRVPLVIASPWSRGGAVCSQVFDHTSIVMFLEKFLSHKTGKKIEETNISSWRRTVCGDLTSSFTPYNEEKYPLPEFQKRNEFVTGIHRAQFRQGPTAHAALTPQEILDANKNPRQSVLPQQEKGTRVSRSLPYEISADGNLISTTAFQISMKADNKKFGSTAAGAPFQIYSYANEFKVRDYAVAAGDVLTDEFKEDHFKAGAFHFRVHGPNGFFREFIGHSSKQTPGITCQNDLPSGDVRLVINNKDKSETTIEITDNSYGSGRIVKKISGKSEQSVVMKLAQSSGWYDFTVRIVGVSDFAFRYAGRVETGRESISDPSMA